MNDLQRADIPFLVRPMQLEDIDRVLLIERASFALPWPASAFRYDLTHNPHAYYLVVTPRQPPPISDSAAGKPSWWQRLWHVEAPHQNCAILGYGGFWALVDEAHISNVAVAPAWRGRGLGDLLMIGLLEKAIEIGMQTATLEVRLSNSVAQKLYRKFGFRVAGERRRYYSDNGEDALIMTTGPLTSPSYRSLLAEIEEHTFERLRRETAPQRS